MTRVVVVSSSPVVRAGLAALLAGHPGFTVLESAAKPGDLAHAASAVEADVILLALEPGEDFSVASWMPDRLAGVPPLVVLGESLVSGWASQAFRSGARGTLSRHATAEQIAAAVAAAAAGLLVREPAPAGRTALPPAPLISSATPALTPREIEVLNYLVEGLGNKTIAARLGISEHTVKTHVGSIFAKLDVSSRAEAVASAARLGLIML